MIYGVSEYGATRYGDGRRPVVSGAAATATEIRASITPSRNVLGTARSATTADSNITVSREVTGGVVSGTTATATVAASREVTSEAVSAGTIVSATVIVLTFYRERPDLVETVVHGGEVDQRERLEGYLKAPFQSPVDPEGGFDDTEFGHFVAAATEFAQGFRYMQEEFLRQQYIDTAQRKGLDEIGEFAGIYRRTEEKDPSYRARIKAGFRGLLGGATLEEVIEITAQLLSCSVSEIDVREPFTSGYARLDVTIPQYVMDRAPVSEAGFVELILMYRAAGIEITLGIGERFTYRSLADALADPEVNDPSQGYANAPYRSSL